MNSKLFKSIILILAVVSLFTLVACGKSNSKNANSQRMGGLAQNLPDIYGEINSISGNQVTLALLEVPQRDQQQNNRQQRNNNNSTNNNGNNNSDNNNNGQPRGNRPNGGFRGGFQAQRNYTGATEIITISKDTLINSFGRSANGAEQKSLSLADLKAGEIIMVYYKADSGDKKEIESITVLPHMNPQNQQNSNTNDNNQST